MGENDKRKGNNRQPTLLTREECEELYLRVQAALDSVEHSVSTYRTLGQYTDLLDRTSPAFFSFVASLLLGDAIQCLCRLTDPAYFRENARLSIRYLYLHTNDPPEIHTVDSAMAHLRELRNNWISHSDLQKILGDERATVTLAEIENAHEAITLWLQNFAQQLEIDNSPPVDQGSWIGVPTLMDALQDGRNVLRAYISVLTEFESTGFVVKVDDLLTQNRAKRAKGNRFSELEWVRIRKDVIKRGPDVVRQDLARYGLSPYLAILLVLDDPSNDLPNWTDRRLVARVKEEAHWLRVELESLERESGDDHLGDVREETSGGLE